MQNKHNINVMQTMVQLCVLLKEMIALDMLLMIVLLREWHKGYKEIAIQCILLAPQWSGVAYWLVHISKKVAVNLLNMLSFCHGYLTWLWLVLRSHTFLSQSNKPCKSVFGNNGLLSASDIIRSRGKLPQYLILRTDANIEIWSSKFMVYLIVVKYYE